jgi:hypothetical protein
MQSVRSGGQVGGGGEEEAGRRGGEESAFKGGLEGSLKRGAALAAGRTHTAETDITIHRNRRTRERAAFLELKLSETSVTRYSMRQTTVRAGTSARVNERSRTALEHSENGGRSDY